MLNGAMLKAGILSASHHLGLHRGEVDALNVFPVPDGDTGTNMSMTVTAAARELALLADDSDFDLVADRVASAMLRGARGNSGVILSLIFRGIARSVKGVRKVSGLQLAQALLSGSDAAYKAVMKPTEGTILTVVRVAAQQAAVCAQGKGGNSGTEVWEAALRGAREALALTPTMLPVLRQAGVVDAGGQGLVYIMEGLRMGFLGQGVKPGKQVLPMILTKDARPRQSAAGRSDEEITFTYCTECIVERKADAPRKGAEELRGSLAGLGDCVVVAEDDEIVKVHVHTNDPGQVLTYAQSYGQFIQVKVENMRKQHQEAAWAGGAGSEEPTERTPAIQKRYGIVAVANGDGMTRLLGEIGVDAVVGGGQSMNPSTEDILNAVNRVPAEHVFILPNNKNIIMAAEQVAPLTERGVSVVQTRSVAEGIGAVLSFDENEDAEVNHVQMQRAAERVQTGLVTYAARDSKIDDLNIRKGAVIGLENGKLTVTEEEPVKAAFRVTRHLVRKFNGSMITAYAGEGVTDEQSKQLLDLLRGRYGNDLEISVIPGGQPLYYFIISVE
ncbi:MAG: DAK2 domain-containing protein [Oscillospiraceae bacterium]|nr:DAK2 domain-containing protein [Oscillospiraceae bacterium]